MTDLDKVRDVVGTMGECATALKGLCSKGCGDAYLQREIEYAERAVGAARRVAQRRMGALEDALIGMEVVVRCAFCGKDVPEEGWTCDENANLCAPGCNLAVYCSAACAEQAKAKAAQAAESEG